MANVTCAACGTEFDEKLKKCPSCGAKNRLKICPVCGAQMAKNAKRCPKCGAKNKKPIYKRWWFWVLVIYLVYRIPLFFTKENIDTPQMENEQPIATATPAPTPTQAPTTDLEVLELVGGMDSVEGVYDESIGSIHITGQVRNNGNKMLDYASIQFSMYDENGNLLGTAMDNIVNFGAGEIWQFDALGISNVPVDTYRLSDLSGNYYGF